MDLSVIKHKILAEIIVFVRLMAENYVPSIDPQLKRDKAKVVLIAILRLTKNFLLVLDERKAPAYKLAIIVDYLEYIKAAIESDMVKGVASIDQDIIVVLRYIGLIKSNPEKVELLIKNTRDTVNQFADIETIHSPLVVFWMQTTCTMDDLRKMQVLMLFSSKEEQAKMFAHDQSLLQNKRFALILECLKEA